MALIVCFFLFSFFHFLFSPEHTRSHIKFSIRLSKKQAYDWQTKKNKTRKQTKKKHVAIKGHYHCGKCKKKKKELKIQEEKNNILSDTVLYTTVGNKIKIKINQHIQRWGGDQKTDRMRGRVRGEGYEWWRRGVGVGYANITRWAGSYRQPQCGASSAQYTGDSHFHHVGWKRVLSR